jgi:hypothetical protein
MQLIETDFLPVSLTEKIDVFVWVKGSRTFNGG